MNILLINHYAGSPDLGMEFRPYYMAKEWQKAGHHVRIVGGSFSHLRKKQPCEYREIVDNVEYCWIPVNRYKGNGVGRIFSMFLFVFKLYHYFVEYLRNFEPDIVIASSTYPLDIYPAYKIAKHYHAKLIYEVHDLWPLSPMELGGYSKKHPFIQIMQKAENDCYRYVDTVVSMLPKAEEHMREHGLGKGKFHYVPNGIVLSDWNNPKGIPEEHGLLLSRFQKEGKLYRQDNIYSENAIINHILNRKIEYCNNNGLSIKCMVCGELKGVSDYDIHIILENLLDNAIEAALKAVNKRISVDIYSDEQAMVIKISNTTEENVLKNNPEMNTTKKDNSYHGYGIKNVSELVKKNNGTIEYIQLGVDIVQCRVLLML